MALELPLSARRFLETTDDRRVHGIVRAFHRWLERRRLLLTELTPEHHRHFCARPRGARVSPRTRVCSANELRGYLQWAYGRGLVGFVPDPARHRPVDLPALAQEFLASLAPTHRHATRLRYTYSLRKLHGWLDAHGLTLERITRTALAPWFQALHTAGLGAVSRSHILIDTRAYLHWVHERRRMRTAPDELIRRTDVPKLPQCLPRPLTAETDRELQRRLGGAQEPGAWALLLMRRTGLRIGELRNLEYHCIRPDERRPLLKVPLGKLNNERLVPLDADAVALIRRLQVRGRRPRPWLIPGFAGARMSYDRLRRLLRTYSHDLPDSARITSHRLRHTYATELLSAGMSLLGVMRLLGHRDYHMTLRYTAITPELVGDEYAKALAQLATKYHLPPPPAAPDPDQLLDQLSRWLPKHIASRHHLRALLKRIERLRHEVRSLQASKRRS